MVDLGSEDAIDDDIVLRSGAPKKTIQAGSGLGSQFSSSLATVTALQLGPYTLRNLPSATGGVQLMGSTVLRKFHIVYDLAHARMFVAPRRGLSARVRRVVGRASARRRSTGCRRRVAPYRRRSFARR